MQCNKLTGKKWKFSSALWQPKMLIFFFNFCMQDCIIPLRTFSLLQKIFVNFNFFTSSYSISDLKAPFLGVVVVVDDVVCGETVKSAKTLQYFATEKLAQV